MGLSRVSIRFQNFIDYDGKTCFTIIKFVYSGTEKYVRGKFMVMAVQPQGDVIT